MQRRYALLATAALVALVLVPGAVLAAGFSNGFGPKSSPPGPQGAPDWAGNETALRANQSANAGDGAGDGTCLGTQDRDRTQLRDGSCQTGQVCDGGQDRAQVRDQTRANRTSSSGNVNRFALQGQHQRGKCS